MDTGIGDISSIETIIEDGAGVEKDETDGSDLRDSVRGSLDG